MSIQRIFAVVAAAGFLLAACGDDDDDGDAATTTTGAGGGGTTLTLVATNFAFDQTALTATADEPVTLVIRNDADSTEHNLTIADLDVDQDVDGGASAEQTVTPAAGTYEYHCEYHPANMKGTLTVS
jgi:plastocyanin